MPYNALAQVKQPSLMSVGGELIGITSGGFSVDGFPRKDLEFCEEVPEIPSMVTLRSIVATAIVTMLQIDSSTLKAVYGGLWSDGLEFPSSSVYPGLVLSGNPSHVVNIEIYPRYTTTGFYYSFKNAYLDSMELLRMSVEDRLVFEATFRSSLGADIEEVNFKEWFVSNN